MSGFRRFGAQRATAEPAQPAPGPGADAPREPEPAEASREPEPAEAAGHYGAELRRSMADAAERIDRIIAAAEQAAAEIRREAELEADRLVETRRREAELESDEHRARVRAAFETMRADLLELERRSLAAVESSRPRSSPLAPSAPATTAGATDSTSDLTSASALIRAGQLAVSGKTRDEIAAVLRSEFGLAHPEEIADEVFRPRS